RHGPKAVERIAVRDRATLAQLREYLVCAIERLGQRRIVVVRGAGHGGHLRLQCPNAGNSGCVWRYNERRCYALAAAGRSAESGSASASLRRSLASSSRGRPPAPTSRAARRTRIARAATAPASGAARGTWAAGATRFRGDELEAHRYP